MCIHLSKGMFYPPPSIIPSKQVLSYLFKDPQNKYFLGSQPPYCQIIIIILLTTEFSDGNRGWKWFWLQFLGMEKNIKKKPNNRITVLSINKWVLGAGRAAGRPLLADELVHDLRALLALDVAAPVELAVAALGLHRLELVVAAAAAHELAAVHALRRLVA